MITLILDGPLRGKLYDIQCRKFQVSRTPKLNVFDHYISDYEQTSLLFEVDTYHVHRFRFMDRVIRVASLRADKPKDSAVISLLLSAKAKKAMEPHG